MSIMLFVDGGTRIDLKMAEVIENGGDMFVYGEDGSDRGGFIRKSWRSYKLQDGKDWRKMLLGMERW